MDATRAGTVGTLHSRARRRWWLASAGVVAGLAGGSVAFALTDRVYSSSTAVLVDAVAGPLRPLGGDVNLDTEAQLARSTQTAADAARRLGRKTTPAELVDAVSVSVVENTSVLVISFRAATPPEAQAGARAFAEAYLDNRAEAARGALTDQTRLVQGKVAEVSAQLARVNVRIANPGTPETELETLWSTRSTLTNQVSSLTTRLNELATTTVKPGRVIQEAPLPTSPARPIAWLYLACGAGAGILLGALAAAGGERLSRRVRHGADVNRRTALPVLAEMSALREPPTGQILAAHHPGGRAFNRLRNEVVAALGIDRGVILVTGASPGPASTLVAANLAASLARADNEVILVGANTPELGVDGMLLSHVFDIADIPGLTDVLTRRAGLSAALQRAPRTPRLRVVTSGATASAAGLLQSEGVRTAMRSLRGQARYVVVEAPSAASGADAQSLAGLADAAILVAEAGRSRHAEVVDAATQLRLVGTRLLGAVIVPRLAPRPTERSDDRPRTYAPPDDGSSAGWDDDWLDQAFTSTVDTPTAVLRQIPTP